MTTFLERLRGVRQWRSETLALLVSLYFTIFSNGQFWSGMLPDPIAGFDGWKTAFCLFVALTAIHYVLITPFLGRLWVRPMLALIILVTACAQYFMSRYHVYLDPSMMRNVLATDVAEAGDLLTPALIPHLLLYAGLPCLLLWRANVRRLSWFKAIGFRLLSLLLALLIGVGAIYLSFQEIASQIRNHRELRFLVTPANYFYSLGRALAVPSLVDVVARTPVGTDAVPGPGWAERKKPVLLVLVLGETARAANWGLSGYARPTTPELAQAGVINFAQVSSCGTNTETSLPCLFSASGRRQYDEALIRNSESLLDVVARAGFRVVWVDNQSGCKGVCRGVESRRPDPAQMPAGVCEGTNCYDEALLKTLAQTVAETPGNLLVVLHQMGNHGPAYFKRYPPAFKHFTPACEDADLARCSPEQIVNAYDNALRYTDHVLASAIGMLQAEKRHDTAMLYLSDHGESLGENGLFLHGVPYAIAPDTQTKVPMVMWLSPGFTGSFGLDAACLARQAGEPISHDYLFHSVLGLLDVQTAVRDERFDFTGKCRHAGGAR